MVFQLISVRSISTPLRLINLSADMNTSEEMNADAEHFLKSLKTLARLAVTSSAFRMLLSDILATTREVIAEAASEVAEIASQVQATAADVSKAVELDNLTVEGLKGKAEESYSGIQQSVGHAHRNLGTLGDDSAERVKDIVVGRVQEVILLSRIIPFEFKFFLDSHTSTPEPGTPVFDTNDSLSAPQIFWQA
jgi:hypothetical protein